jgi:hypothetical protein
MKHILFSMWLLITLAISLPSILMVLSDEREEYFSKLKNIKPTKTKLSSTGFLKILKSKKWIQ